jgi:hypothetical protein
MKKFITILLISCSSLLLTGCFGGENEVDVDSSYNIQSFVGVVKDLSDASVNATHLLETDIGEQIYLRSPLFDLSDFVGSTLRVTGGMEELETGERILSVDSKDILNLEDNSSEPFLYEFDEKGFEIELPQNKYEISESETLANFVAEDYSFSVRVIPKGLELDLELYLDENYGDQIPQDVMSNLGDRYSKLTLSSGRWVYIHNTDSVIYELIFNSDGSDNAEMNLEINNVIDNIFYNPEDIEQDTKSEVSEIDETDKDDEQEEKEDSNTEEGQSDNNTASEPVDLSALTAEVSQVVKTVNSQKNAKVDSEASIYKYSITDNSYVYVSYINDDEDKFRKLFKVEGDNLSETAYFQEGVDTDWELISGENVAYDRPLKMVFVEDEGYRQVEVKEGYRYFESRPLSLGFHYPRQWYYAGGSKSYEFSNKPLPDGETLVMIEVLDEKFNKVGGTSVSGNIKKENSGSKTIYYVEKEDGEVLKISGEKDYSEEINIMAQTMVEIDK